MLCPLFQPRLQLPERDRPVADAVLLLLVHLGESLALVFEDGIPALHVARQYVHSPQIYYNQLTYRSWSDLAQALSCPKERQPPLPQRETRVERPTVTLPSKIAGS